MRRVLALLTLLLVAPGAAGAAPAAPGFRVRLLDASGQVDSRELIGKKILVLRFQASYCKPCARESPAFAALVERFRGRGVEFLALHVQDTAADARAFIAAHRVTYPVALDPRLTIGNRFGFRGTPYTVVIDRQGEMVVRLHGESVMRRLPRLLNELLGPESGRP